MEVEDEAELWSLKSERSFLSRAWMASLPTALAGASDPSDSDWTGPEVGVEVAPGGGAGACVETGAGWGRWMEEDTG